MAIRLSGMISGMDTDSMVQELVSAYSTKKDSYQKDLTALEWKKDAWKSLNTEVYSFYTNSLSSMQYEGAYSLKSAASSDETKATATASNSSVTGTQTLEVKKLAAAGYLTGARISKTDGKDITDKTKLKDLGITGSGSFAIVVDGKKTEVAFDENISITQLMTNMKESGVGASFDSVNQRIFINSKESGEANDFQLLANTANSVNVMKTLGIYSMTEADRDEYEQIATESDEDLASRALKTFAKNTINKAIDTYTQELNEKNTLLSYYNMTSTKRLDKIASLEKELENDTLTQEDKDAVNEQIATIREIDASVAEGTFDSDKEALTAQIALLKENITTQNGYLKSDTTLAKYIQDNTLDTTSQDYQDIYTQYIDMRTAATGLVAAYDTIEQYNNATDEEKAALQEQYEAANSLAGESSGAVRIIGSDSRILLNGAEFISESNNFSINGLTISAKGLTDEDSPITITTQTDVDAIYNKIKDFFKSYNTLINKMDSLYNADSAKGYEPLTDDEKEAMTDTQIEKWEEKIKAALLRRDSTLNNITSAIKTMMTKGYTVNDKTYSLSSFGIKTLGYFTSAENEQGAYHIDGNADDSATSANTDKLRSMIASDPETVMSFFSQLTQGLYTKLTDKMQSSTISSAYTIYNDKTMASDIDDLEDTISDWEDKIDDYEEKYSQQFADMETALSRLQSQSSYVTQMLS